MAGVIPSMHDTCWPCRFVSRPRPGSRVDPACSTSGDQHVSPGRAPRMIAASKVVDGELTACTSSVKCTAGVSAMLSPQIAAAETDRAIAEMHEERIAALAGVEEMRQNTLEYVDQERTKVLPRSIDYNLSGHRWRATRRSLHPQAVVCHRTLGVFVVLLARFCAGCAIFNCTHLAP